MHVSIDSVRRDTPGRRCYPMGRGVGNSPLRAPPSLAEGERWPPTVRVAERRYRETIRRARDLPRPAFDYAAALFHRGSPDDVVEAFSLFNGMAREKSKRLEVYRAAALFNATLCMQALPSRSAQLVSGELLLSAVAAAVGDSIIDSVRRAAHGAASMIVDEATTAPLVWRRPGVLVGATTLARSRIPALPREIAGSWRGVRAGLLESGLVAPAACSLEAPVLVALPTARTVRVVPA